MLSAVSLLVVFFFLGIIPITFGLLIRIFVNQSPNRRIYSQSFTFGIVIAFFLDFVINSSQLGINSGFSISSLLLVFSFIFGFLSSYFINEFTRLKSSFSYVFIISFTIAYHSLAEGLIIGYDINQLGLYISVERSIQLFSFLSHKIAEGFIIPGFFLLSISQLLSFATIASFPIIIGYFLGAYNFPGIISSIFFAISSGGLMFLIVNWTAYIKTTPNQKNYHFLFMLLGFLLIYITGLLHSL
tara:strand:- start:51 stop:779 length:729 start_codon:yes stop_codon:yes gene_type:complete